VGTYVTELEVTGPPRSRRHGDAHRARLRDDDDWFRLDAWCL